MTVKVAMTGQNQENMLMLTRAAFGLAIVLASVSGTLAAHRAHATADAHTVNNPAGADAAAPRTSSESAPTVWGWPYQPPRQ
jgi:hypothetical protein